MTNSIDPTKPGPDADRIAELRQKIHQCESDISRSDSRDVRMQTYEKMAEHRAELSRLRNEQPELNTRGEPMDAATIARGRRPADSDNAPFRNEQPKGDDAALTQWRREPTCFYDGRNRPIGNNADEWQVFLEHWLDVRDGRVRGTSFVCVQIAEAIDAAEKRGCVLASLAPGAKRQSDAQPVAWRVKDFGDGCRSAP